ncbi:MAG: hypothetical protein MUO76_24850, partial [Anaerolineaceae bacterium]|nr:hypothetical protein [Anaerolineaceae bacterium]
NIGYVSVRFCEILVLYPLMDPLLTVVKTGCRSTLQLKLNAAYAGKKVAMEKKQTDLAVNIN